MKHAVISPCEYDFSTAIQKLNQCLKQKKPKVFNPFWMKANAGNLYEYFSAFVQLPSGGIDWDFITAHLDKSFQKRWNPSIEYSDSYNCQRELNEILVGYQKEMHMLYVPQNNEEKIMQDRIIIQLVRLAQRGNSLAKEKVLDCTSFVIYEWMENSKCIKRWKNYSNEIPSKVESCIKNYRYSGSFIKYLYMTFYYSSRGLRTTVSLDQPIGSQNKKRMDYIAYQD